jgi:hypothetical protein
MFEIIVIQKYELLTLIIQCVAALATFSAVLMSLYLSRRRSRIKVEVTDTVDDGKGLKYYQDLWIEVHNYGECSVTINYCGIQQKNTLFQLYLVEISGLTRTKSEVKLQQFRINAGDTAKFCCARPNGLYDIDIVTRYVFVRDTVGKEYYSWIKKRFRIRRRIDLIKWKRQKNRIVISA